MSNCKSTEICGPEVRIRDKTSTMLVRPELAKEITSQWFEPEWWGRRCQPVGHGGRSAAWFINETSHYWFLREYCRRGYISRLSKKTYLFPWEAAARSFTEFRLLGKLQSLNLPVPKPIAACYRKTRPMGYQAAILMEQFPQALPLHQYADVGSLELWEKIGRTIAQFHQAGLDHADLNVKNVLVKDDDILLVDFDRCALRPEGSWCSGNLARLKRSIMKHLSLISENDRPIVWRHFLKGYQSLMKGYENH